MTLTVERLRQVLNYDPETGKFIWKVSLAPRGPIGAKAGCSDGARIVVRIDGKLYLAHRLAWLYVTGLWPDGEIDHINMDQSDNRFCNLRSADRSENQRNTIAHRDSKSGLKGVSFDVSRGRWVAKICVHGKNKQLGRFPSKEEACEAYRKAAIAVHGEFARTS